MSKARVYRVYGVSVRSDWELPYCEQAEEADALIELTESSSEALRDVASEAAAMQSAPGWYKVAHLHDGSTFLHFPGLFNFHVSADGRQVLANRLTDSDDEVFETYLLAFALSYALLELGIEQLHATCVLINGSAAGFMGESTHGKSTLAGAFVGTGYRLITDDISVLRLRSDGFHVSPGLPRIKLFPEVAQFVLGNRARGKPMNPHTEKMVIPLKPHQFHREETPLKTLYVLAYPWIRVDERAVQIRPFSNQNAFVALCKASFNSNTSKPERLKRQFLFATQVASAVPVKLLSYRNGMDSLDLVRDAVLSDLA